MRDIGDPNAEPPEAEITASCKNVHLEFPRESALGQPPLARAPRVAFAFLLVSRGWQDAARTKAQRVLQTVAVDGSDPSGEREAFPCGADGQ
jgi:hypothetical protein